jgi:surfactin synthase thioesterase subunit
LDERLESLPGVARRLASEILCDVEGPVALYGHRVGPATAAEVAHLLVAAGKPPIGVIAGGAMPAL